MSPGLALALIASGVLLVVVRRRSAAIAVVAAQSLLLGAAAMASGIGHSTAMATGGAALIAKGVVLPVVLLWVVRRTREPRLIVEERHAGTRAAVSVALALGLVLILPPLGLEREGAQTTAAALMALGIAAAVLRRAAIFQALGLLVAENGVYAAALGTPHGLPGLIEVGLVFDLVVVISVAAAFSAKIHAEFGTADTALLGELRD